MKAHISADRQRVAGVSSRREQCLCAKKHATMELAAIREAIPAEGVDEIFLPSR